ncbi:extracellular solute-binding protein [Haloplanus halophilus]|uniref:extracellular solute-binding protein n=1 Tax=Haloplanus halophilus TaxID=2949993 RepID=UPI0020407407|nr:ABC transporter substrate-binding protein [Haloplanus sp. GDY1]
MYGSSRSRGVSRRAALGLAGSCVVGMAGCLGSAGSGGDGPADTVVQYNAVNGWANYQTIRNTFTEQTGIDFPEDTKNSGQTLNALTNEQDNPQADAAYMGITDAIKADSRGLCAPYEVTGFDEIPDQLKHPDGNWFSNHYATVGWAVNTGAVDEPPETWEDLLDERFENGIGLYNPDSAFNGFINFVNANLAMGGSLDDFDPGIQFFSDLQSRGNIATMPKQGVVTSFFKGEIPVLLAYDFNAYMAKYQSDLSPDEVKVVVPSDLSVQVPYTLNLVADAPRPEAGKRCLDFQLSDQGQKIFARAFVNPIRPSVELPSEVQERKLPQSAYEASEPIDYTKLESNQQRARSRFVGEIL